MCTDATGAVSGRGLRSQGRLRGVGDGMKKILLAAAGLAVLTACSAPVAAHVPAPAQEPAETVAAAKTVSKPPTRRITVPDLTGMTLADALVQTTRVIPHVNDAQDGAEMDPRMFRLGGWRDTTSRIV
jgi:hypothetical protein